MILALHTVLDHSVWGVRANISFWCVVREGYVVKVVVDSVHFGGGDVLTTPLTVPGVVVLFNLLKRVFAEPTLIELRQPGQNFCHAVWKPLRSWGL